VRISAWIVCIAIVLSTPAQAQIVHDMTPERIREAIAFGTKVKDLGPYQVQEKARFSWPPLIAYYTTPFLRVALAANMAKKHYKQFTEADVTPKMVAPEIDVYAPSHSGSGAHISNVETVVLMPSKSKDASRALHPTEISEASEEYKNLLGFSGQGQAMLAVFPLEVWQENSELHVVFDQAIPSSHGAQAMGGCVDCKSKLYLEKVR